MAGAASLALAATLAGALFRILRRPDYLPDRPAAIRLFLVGLALDALWSWMFFAGRHPTLALVVAATLACVSAGAAWTAAAVDRRAAGLLVPWVLAAVFALLTDLSIAVRNG